MTGPVSIQPVTVFVDSGTEGNFMDKGLVKKLGVRLVELEQPVMVRALDKRMIHKVTHRTEAVHLLVSGNHR